MAEDNDEPKVDGGIKKKSNEPKAPLRPQEIEVNAKVPEADLKAKEPPIVTARTQQATVQQAGSPKYAPSDAAITKEERDRMNEERRRLIMERNEQLRKQREGTMGPPPAITPEEREKYIAQREAQMKEIRSTGPGSSQEWMHRNDLARGPPRRDPREFEELRKQEMEVRGKPREDVSQDDPSKVLATRFAKGEITEEEYRKKLAVLKELNP
jgi:hypothetical protein